MSEPHPYTSAESPYATPHKVSMPEECPMAENTFKILSAEGRSVRLLTARLKWCCTEQSKKARLISLVSKRREVISWQRACANGWLSSPRRMSPASTPHRKSSPLGVRPIPEISCKYNQISAFFSFIYRLSEHTAILSAKTKKQSPLHGLFLILFLL